MSGVRRAAWLLGLGVVAVGSLMVWQLLGAAQKGRHGRVGDGKDPATYGFALDLPDPLAATVTASGLARDGLHPLSHPPLLSPAQVDSLNHAERGKYLVSTDLVLGVLRGGVARAWPLRMLDWHECANDTVGGEPLVAVWSPLAGCARVFHAGRNESGVRSFASSGLLAASTPLLYVHGDTLSLWSPVSGAAVSGPAAAAAQVLQDVPAIVCDWASWRTMHPETTVPWPDPEYRKRYKSEPYFAYRHGGRLRFPVTDPGQEPLRRRLVLQDAAGTALVDLVAAPASGGWTVRHGGRSFTLTAGAAAGVEAPPVWLEGGETRDDVRAWPVFDFAWRAFGQPDVEVLP
ncbi:MAG TPA: DUF3179 domain-containing (seleno)protein [Candidatus Krumholzibacteria bacterium]|nr:DUF3179 domain-containing (seleno)protein [Candidatus Krumholzibacteria bacterium]HRX51345.1 DUF3179 domain-containing (seleno)protein [Candidatus Krumholzibacteria bacterium]